MSATPPAYRSFISPRSRRLRTIGLVLLVAALGMMLYGTLSLMPTLRHAIHRETQTATALAAGRPVSALEPAVRARIQHARKAAAAQAIFAYTYWAICALIVAALIVVAWLDVREVQRRYIDQRIALFAETAQRLKRDRED
jgi:hypothetical protein